MRALKHMTPLSSRVQNLKHLTTKLGPQLGALCNPFFGWEGSPTRIDYRKKKVGTLI